MASDGNVVANRQRNDAPNPTSMELVINAMKPKFPQYALSSKRRESFIEASIPWPQDAPVGVEELVEAGLVYTGVGDSVRCYHCGGGLRNWEQGDNPMEEHAKWYPTCQHVLNVKGKTYIQKVKDGKTPEGYCVVERKPEKETEVQMADVYQTLTEFGFARSDTEIALNIFKNRNGPYAPFKSSDLVSILMEIDDDPVVMNEYNSITGHQEFTTPDAEGMDDNIAIEEKNQKFKDSSICRICLNNRADVSFLPCGHIVSCPQCSPALNNCPVCHKPIMGRLETFDEPVVVDIEAIREENKKMKESILCKICKRMEVDTVFLPCGHLVICWGCSALLENSCFKCWKKRDGKVRIRSS